MRQLVRNRKPLFVIAIRAVDEQKMCIGGGLQNRGFIALRLRLLHTHKAFAHCPADARHAKDQHFSWRSGPFAGSGIKYAIEDAVVTANLLAEPLKAASLCLRDLAEVKRRREWPT